MSMSFFEPFFQTINDTVETVTDTVAGNLVGYVNGATTIAAIVVLILFGLQLSLSAREFPLKKLLGIFTTVALVSALATVPANYHDYISTHLMALPEDLAIAVSGDDSFENIGEYLDAKFGGIFDGIGLIFSQAGTFNLGPALIGIVLFTLCGLLCGAAVVSIVMGKVGLALVVALGPIFIFALITPFTKDMFTRWLSLCLQFAVLQALIAAALMITDILITRHVAVLSNPTWDYGDLVPVMGPTIVMLVLIYLFGQLPSLASSLTGGMALAMGNLAWTGTAAGMGYAGAGAGWLAGKAAGGAAAGTAWAARKAWRAMRGGSTSNSVSEGDGGNAVTRSGSGPGRNRNPVDTAPKVSAPGKKFGTAAALERMKKEAERQTSSDDI